MENRGNMQPVYKCWLCGNLFYPWGAIFTRDEAKENIGMHADGEKPPTIDTVSMIEYHECHGDDVGDLGVGDLLGYRSVGEEG